MPDARGHGSLEVVVVGGGIGGLTTAIALARHGLRVRVLEQAPRLVRVGASIALGPNAIRLLADLGLLDALRRIGVRPDAVELLRWEDGSVLLHTDVGAPAEEHFGAPPLDFHRADLQDVLVGALPPQALQLGAHVVAVEQSERRAAAVLEDGRRVEGDVLVAADGIRSPIRQLLVGADEPAFSGTVVYRGVVSREAVATIHPDRVNRYWLGPYRHGVCYWIAAGELLAVNAAVQHAEWSRESWTDEASAEECLQYFDGWHPPLLERIARCRTMLRGAVFVRRPLAHWSFGRITLLGDAAHAMEPFQAQGAAQAIEDAYILAECLRDAAADEAPGALARYEHLRTQRAAELQSSSSTAANVFYLPDGREQQERDAAYASLHERLPWGHRQTIWEHDVRDALRAST